VRLTPPLQFHVNPTQIPGPIRLAIFRARRNLRINRAMHQASGFQLSKLQSQSSLRNTGQLAAQLAETANTRHPQVPQDQHLPLSPKHLQRLLDQPSVRIVRRLHRFHPPPGINLDSISKICAYLCKKRVLPQYEQGDGLNPNLQSESAFRIYLL
jgi:hypothetical protein